VLSFLLILVTKSKGATCACESVSVTVLFAAVNTLSVAEIQ
jgi:hypothetical protein